MRIVAQLTAAIAPWHRGYDRSWLSKDIVAGLAAGAVVIPEAMAYAAVASLPVQVGLYTGMVPTAVYALLGGSRTLSVSTTSTIAILTASTLVAADVAAGSRDPARALAALTLLVGASLLVARLLRLGVLIDNISEATLTGIKAGVGLTVAAGQLLKVLGIPGNPNAGNFFSELRAVIDQLDSQTAINHRSGARTQLSELVTVVLAIACALFLGSVLSDLPQATLGCMVIIAVLGLIDPAAFVSSGG